MRKMPQIPEVQKRVRMTTSFSGYNHNDVISDGEMFDTTNLSGYAYPALTTRKRRGITDMTQTTVKGIHGRDQLVYIRGRKVYYNHAEITGLNNLITTSDAPRKIVSMGAYVCIWPDKVYFNTIDTTDCGSMERTLEISGSSVELIMCRGDGTDYDMTAINQGVLPPEPAENGMLWLDQSGDADVLRQYSANTMDWVEVPSVYVKISGTGIGSGLNEYDAVAIDGLATKDPEQGEDEDEKLKAQVNALNGSFILYGAGEDYIIVAGIIYRAVEAGELKANTVKVDRTVPDLDFICESNNRLWGCKYGLENGVVVNEIRASKLGDFRNWGVFMGLSTDSYTASIGTDGYFTGAISQRGYPVFFKENAIHRVSGNLPSNFSIQTTVARGVQLGSWRSLAVVNENIYYKSRDGVMLYDGNMPISVSEQLGNVLYSDARAGALKDMYYISMKDAEEHWNLFTYDTKHGTWYREDDLKALGFGCVADELYAIDEENNTLVAFMGSEGDPEDGISWSAEFGISGVDYEPGQNGMTRSDLAGNHYVSRFDIRMRLAAGAEATLEIQYNSSGHWEKQGTIHCRQLKNYVIPVIPKRCDHLRFRIHGSGEMKIFSIARIVEVGADG